MNRINIVLADDQRLFVDSLKTVIESRTEDIKVVGIAFNGSQAVKLVEEKKPRIVLMDVRMPGMGGVEATRIIHERFPGVRVVMLTTYDDDHDVQQALSNGAVGYLLKDLPPEELISVLRVVGSGVSLVSPKIMARLLVKLDSIVKTPNEVKEKPRVPDWFRSLSSRERQILILLSNGLENKEIAGRLFLAEQTVKNHVSAIYAKIDVSNRIKATQLVRDFNIV